jgi:hypothetical protein
MRKCEMFGVMAWLYDCSINWFTKHHLKQHVVNSGGRWCVDAGCPVSDGMKLGAAMAKMDGMPRHG